MAYSGEYLVQLARKTIETYLSSHKKISIPNDAPKDLFDQSGTFVTLHTIHQSEEHRLRGCIGRIVSPNSTLIQSAIDSAIDAAVNDPRFPPVTMKEMNNIVIEVTILTVPTLLTVTDPTEYFELIEIGKHGLIAERGYNRGLLLPQVPTEQGWDLETYLDYICMKANLPPKTWQDLETKISVFEGLIYSEVSPKGEIIRRNSIN